CWGWALVFAHRAIFSGSRWAWPLTGFVVGIGILAKYTMAVFIPSVFLFLIAAREYRVLVRRPGFWVMVCVSAVCCLPILIWNAEHDWMSVRHLLALAGFAARSPEEITTGSGIHWIGPLNYVGGQAALLLGFWFVVWLLAMWAHRPSVEADAGIGYL